MGLQFSLMLMLEKLLLNIKELVMAENKGIYIKNMALAMRKFKAPGKNGVVNAGKFSYNYATLDDIINAINKAVEEAGVYLMHDQDAKYEDGHVLVKTVIRAVSEDGIDYWNQEFSWFAVPSKPQAKEIGGAVTYARRYSLSAAFGIATQEDKDAVGLEVTQQQPNAPINNNQNNYPHNNETVSNEPTEYDLMVSKIPAMIKKASELYEANPDLVAKWEAMKPEIAYKDISNYVQLIQKSRANIEPEIKSEPVTEVSSNPSDIFNKKVE